MRKILPAVATAAAVLSSSLLAAPPAQALPADRQPADRLPAEVYGGAWKSGHVQGIAVDRRKGFMYFSFTDLLVKTDLKGKPIGSVSGFTGHLGDLDFNSGDGRVYGSLEYKEAKAFYIAIFDVDKITKLGMDAETSGVVSTVYLKEVVQDYTADMNGDGKFDGNIGDTPDHRYGCSGIDGVAFGPRFGKRGGPQRLTVAYGVYSNTTRADNDHQVVLQYDIARWRRYERPLTQEAPHTIGPARTDGKFFAYTGNTTYGVQNLEYDEHTRKWLMAAYKGKKAGFPNYSLFTVDGTKRPVTGAIRGQQKPERGLLLPLSKDGLRDPATGVRGWESSGQYGLASLGGGAYYVVQDGTVQEDGVTKQTARAQLHRWTGRTPTPFEKVG